MTSTEQHPEQETRESFIDKRGWPIVDKLIADLLWRNVTIDGQPVYADTDLRSRLAPHPDDLPAVELTDEEQDDLDELVEWPAICVERLPGGGINADGYEDINRIRITAFGLTRDQSDAMTADIRGLMHEHSDEEWAGVEFYRIREETGPGRIPDPNEDLRAVPTTWTVKVPNQPR